MFFFLFLSKGGYFFLQSMHDGSCMVTGKVTVVELNSDSAAVVLEMNFPFIHSTDVSENRRV